MDEEIIHNSCRKQPSQIMNASSPLWTDWVAQHVGTSLKEDMYQEQKNLKKKNKET